MANDLLEKLEEKINEAIETIELSRMEVTDLKEQNEELENRYADWETRLSTLIEKFEQLEDNEDVEVTGEINTVMQDTDEDLAEEVEAEEALGSEDSEVVEAETETETETVDSLGSEDSEDEEVEDSFDEEDLGSTFGTNVDSFTEAPESAQHYA